MGPERLATIRGSGPVRRVEVRVAIRTPIARVWDALTRIEPLRAWWSDGSIDPREGGRITLGDDAELDGTVKISAAPHIWSFTWHERPDRAPRADWIEPRTRGLVHFDLIEVDGATLLTLVQFAPRETAAATAAGWHHLAGERLRSFLETGRVEDPPGRFETLLASYERHAEALPPADSPAPIDRAGEAKLATIVGSGTNRRVELQHDLDAPIATVWEAITNLEAMAHWWPDWRPGGHIQRREGGSIVLGDGSWIDGKVKLWNPPHIFAFTWRESVEPPDDWFEASTKSLLRIDLTEIARDRTHLTLLQFMPSASAAGGTAGWHHFVGDRLPHYLESGRVDERPGRFEALRALYTPGATPA